MAEAVIPYELDFIATFFERKLRAFERSVANRGELLAEQLSEALRMRQSLCELRSDDGGCYTAIGAHLDATLDAERRLTSLIGERRGAGAATGARRAPVRRPFRTVWLDEYLETLVERFVRTRVSTSSRRSSPLGKEAIFHELAAFLEALVVKSDRRVGYLFLLRDTLLLYLGAKRLEYLGWRIRPSATLVSRALLKHLDTASDPCLYDQLFEVLYFCVAKRRRGVTVGFINDFRRRLRAIAGRRVAELQLLVGRTIVNQLQRTAKVVAVDSGLHGTMPLLMAALVPSVSQIRLYTAVPWLQSQFHNVIFTRESVKLRSLERLTCQEHLFAFAGVDRGRITIRQYEDHKTVVTSYAEISSFMAFIDDWFGIPRRH